MENFNKLIQAQFDKMCKTGKLFRSKVTGQEVWDKYIESFEDDPIFRDPESSSHNCNLCKNFIRRYGNIIAIDKNYKIMTIWDVNPDEVYKPSAKAISKLLKSKPVLDVFFETFDELKSLPYESCNKTQPVYKLGMSHNVKRYTKEEAEKFGVVKPNEIRTFHHMYVSIPTEFINKSGLSAESIRGTYRAAKDVFTRGMEEISFDTLTLVKDLIIQKSLLDGQTHLFKVEKMIELKKEFDLISPENRNNWCWINSYNNQFAKFRNELIGTLCSDLSQGMDLNTACQTWNKRVDPANYMKASAPITKRQIEEAQKFVEENGYLESFNRRFATIDDIKASEILHMNSGKGELKKVSIFDSVKSTSTRHKKAEFDKVEEVSIDTFMKDILPTCTSVEAYLENRLEGNLVSLTTSNVKESKPIFKWTNNYSWTFNGNLAGKSMIKENVKEAGGKVDGVLRFSIMWSGDNIDNSDLDAHCEEPHGNLIYYGHKKSKTGGNLDVDIRRPLQERPKGAVENITFPNTLNMIDGDYVFKVHQFSASNSKGFKAEIEFNGEQFQYEYNNPLSGKIKVATVSLKNGIFTIKHHLPEVASSKEIYNLETNNFHKVNLVCLSPNHWDENNVGNKHYLFMLDGCKCPTSIRSFHSENLIPELAQHRKVLEVLGNSTMIAPADKQLSGLGFNATVHDELIVRLQGSFKRVIKIKF